MLTLRAMAAVAIIVAGGVVAATPALAACDSIYNPSCQPIPAKEPPEEATEPAKVSKPLQINRRHASRKAARAERSAQTQRKRFGKKTSTQRALTLRQRRAKALASVSRERTKAAAVEAADEPQVAPPPVRRVTTPRRLSAAAAGASTGEATDINAAADVLQPTPVVTVPAAPVEAPRAAPPASQTPVRTVAQSEMNEIDLAAAATTDPADQSWMRTLVLAFGGVLAVGSALRLFL